ncbi:aminotransferase class IV [Cellulomonas sp. Marseille-Q8402]
MSSVTTVWAGGRLRDPAEPLVTALDPGLTTGLGVFETCAVADGRAFALTRHLDRMATSLDGLGLPAVDRDEVRAGVAAVLAADPGARRLRITATPGAPGAVAPTLVVTAGPAPVRGPAHVVRVGWVRNERSPLAGHKSTSYAADVLALAAATRAGGNEAVLANTHGDLCEGTGSNVFVERGGELLTPGPASGCLPGVTRALVLEWAGAAGLPVREAAPGELPWAVLDEVVAGAAHLALSGSLRGFAGVHVLDGAPVAPGPLSAEVARLFAERAGADPDP